MANKLSYFALILIFLLSGCGPQNCPDCYVVVPTSDNTLPTVGMDIYDPDIPISISQTSQPISIIAVSDAASVLAYAADVDGGIKALNIWATYTYYKPGQISGPGLVQSPIQQYTSNAAVGEQTLKNPIASYKFELKKELGGWSRIKVDVWIEAENFHGGKVQTPVVSLTYPTRQDGDTDYIAYCRKVRVPIPPDLPQLYPIPTEGTQSTTGWVFQGKLQTNLLQPGQDAYVWTYSDPVRRGACIALPRGSGGQPNGLSGIICQSAETGNACFWDSRKRDNNDPQKQMPALDWGSQQLKCAELKDASNITEPGSGICTDCHRGNNVFIISPDDPTWAKVLRGPLVTNPGSTFTIRVQYSSDMTGGHPRYSPVTYPAYRPNWVNAFSTPAAETCALCHDNAQDFKIEMEVYRGRH